MSVAQMEFYTYEVPILHQHIFFHNFLAQYPFKQR